MHSKAHGEVPNIVLEVDEKIVELFLGRIENPENTSSTDLHIINDPAQPTLLIVRYKMISLTNIQKSCFDSHMQQSLKFMRTLFKKHKGWIIEYDQSYLLISFKSAHNGVQCAIDLEILFKEKIASLFQSNISLKIGLSTGVPVEANKTFFEDTIKMTNRLCFIHKASIVITSEVEKLLITENSETKFEKDGIYILPILEEKHLNSIIDFLEEEWQNIDLKVKDFEKPLNMSKTQVYKKFIFLTGISPNNFLKEYRLNQAFDRINKNIQTFSEVAYETGFNSLSYFSKSFYNRFHLLPSEYIRT